MSNWTLYRLFDRQGRLLYVGITKRGWPRVEEHAQKKDWWVHVATAQFAHYRSRDAAHTAEKRAIAKERPQHNVKHNGADTAVAAGLSAPLPIVPNQRRAAMPVAVRYGGLIPDPSITPTLPVWPDAGKLLGYKSKAAAYRAAKSGHIPTVQLSERRWVVPTAALLEMLAVTA